MELKKELYKKAFPEDADFDWSKFKQYKKEAEKGNDFCKAKQEKKEALYKILFPEDVEFNWEKFKAQKKQIKQEKKKQEKTGKQDEILVKNNSHPLFMDINSVFEKQDEKKIEMEKKLPEKKNPNKFSFVKDYNKQETPFLVLDADNIFLAHERINNLKLKESEKAEKILALLSAQFGLKTGANSLNLVYESTKTVFSKKFEDLELNVYSARPDFKSSTEVLVDWMDRKRTPIDTTLFVTQDEGLIAKLREKGAKYFMSWGLGIGDWGLGPNPQSPIPNPQFFNYKL